MCSPEALTADETLPAHRIAIAIKGAPPPLLHSRAREDAQGLEADLVAEDVWLLDGLPQLLPWLAMHHSQLCQLCSRLPQG